MPSLWTVQLPTGELTEGHEMRVRHALRTAIDRVTMNGVLVFCDSYSIALDALEAVGSAWLVQKGDIAGTFPKRLATWFRRNQRALLDADKDRHITRAIAELGAQLGPEVNHAQTYLCDLARPPFSWVGQFGDNGSCYRPGGQYSKARVALEDCGYARALRFWCGDDAGNVAGIGRCWVYVDEYGSSYPTDSDTTRVFLFNAYGVSLYVCARILAAVLGLSYHKCALTNDEMYINGNSGYVLLPHDQTPSTEYDLGIDVPSSRCPNCDADEECAECDNCSELSCACGFCHECDNTRCECECCQHCETYDRCRSCNRCHNCGRAPGE